MSFLISGASSGLGKFLAEHFKADRYDRTAGKAPGTSYNTIIHCAFDVRRQVSAEEEAQYQRNTLGITQDLLAIPHKRFVFISTVDVSQQGDRYGQSKLAAETLVTQRGTNPLILRPTSMLGPYIRPNSLTKILSGENPKLTLAANSSFNYVLHSDIAAFIEMAPQAGTYTLASTGNVTLDEVCKHFGKTAQFGDYRYDVSSIDNSKAAEILPAFKQSSLSCVEKFLKR
jgi:dTDP-4-dehydrorhamnose reductase